MAEELLPLLDRSVFRSKKTSAVALLLRGSAVVGRLLRYCDRGDFEGAKIAIPSATLAPLLEGLWCKKPDWRNLPDGALQIPGEIGAELAQIAWQCGPEYRQLLREQAKERFAEVMLWDEARRLFDMLWECGEQVFLTDAVTAKLREMVDCLHNTDPSSRTGIIANLLDFARRLGMKEAASQLTDRLLRTRISYNSAKEWVFQPLARWFQLVRKTSPAAWKTEGVQILDLDNICKQQSGENEFEEEVIAEVSAAAMDCGPDDFEALFAVLASRETKYPLWNLAIAAQDGFQICLRERHAISAESTLARIAIAIALGRWPKESALKTIVKLLSANGVPQELAQQPAWQKALRVAEEIQGVSAEITPRESSDAQSGEPPESRSAEVILQEIIQPPDSSWSRLRDLASLAKQARAENNPNRDRLVGTALETLESAEVFSRYVEFHDFNLMSQLYRNLTESERWRLLGAITAVTGEISKELERPNWAFMIAYNAVDLMCRCRAIEINGSFAIAAFHQLLETHWKWHGVSAPASPVIVRKTPTPWPDAARRILISLLQTDACETVYMAMSGLRFFAESFPDQIPPICRDGLADEISRDAILALGQLWATRHPGVLAPVPRDFAVYETNGAIEDRLDAWAVGALHSLASEQRPRGFPIPDQIKSPEIAFPGDGPLFEGEAEMDGLMRNNSFAGMANLRLRRAGIVLGSMDSAFRYMARMVREGKVEFPPMTLPAPKRLAFDSSSPRQRDVAEPIVGDAIFHQCAGQTWQPAKAATVRILIGFGMDPWISSATPNIWPDKEAWPSDFDIEKWCEAGAPDSADVGLRLKALLEGHDLDPSMLLLGAMLHCPTHRRDLCLCFWLAVPGGGGEQQKQNKPLTPSGRTLAGWLAGWSFAASRPTDAVAVHFTGGLVNYPNSDLDVTPTDHWHKNWGWTLDPENGLHFLSKDGMIAARYERWLNPGSNSPNRICRQPILNRWVARRDCFPAEYDELRAWVRRTDRISHYLPHPE